MLNAAQALPEAAGQTLVFRAVPDDARLDAKALTISAAQLRIFEARQTVRIR